MWYEREADLFSVKLLIPEFLFHRRRKEFPLGLEGVKGLAKVLQTSLTAMGIRYATLCTQPVAVVVSEEDRILYSVLSKPFAISLGVIAGGTALAVVIGSTALLGLLMLAEIGIPRWSKEVRHA